MGISSFTSLPRMLCPQALFLMDFTVRNKPRTNNDPLVQLCLGSQEIRNRFPRDLRRILDIFAITLRRIYNRCLSNDSHLRFLDNFLKIVIMEGNLNVLTYRTRTLHLWRRDYPMACRQFLSKRGRQRQRREARKMFLRNPRILLSISLLWLPCMFLFSLKLFWIQRLLDETMDVSSWNVGLWRQRGNGAVEVSFESRAAQMSALFHIFRCAFCLV